MILFSFFFTIPVACLTASGCVASIYSGVNKSSSVISTSSVLTKHSISKLTANSFLIKSLMLKITSCASIISEAKSPFSSKVNFVPSKFRLAVDNKCLTVGFCVIFLINSDHLPIKYSSKLIIFCLNSTLLTPQFSHNCKPTLFSNCLLTSACVFK